MTQPIGAKSIDGKRFYPSPRTCKELISVTTVLSGAINKPFIVPWTAKTVSETALYLMDNFDEFDSWRDEDLLKLLKKAPTEERDSAGRVGDVVHELCDAQMQGKSVNYAELYENLSENEIEIAKRKYMGFTRFLQDFEVHATLTEASVYNDEFEYAGSCDFFGTINGVPCVMDYKTSKGIYPEVALQLSAYAHAEYYVQGTKAYKVPVCEKGYVLHLHGQGDRGYTLQEVSITSTTFAHFITAKDLMADWVLSDSKTALGEILYPEKLIDDLMFGGGNVQDKQAQG